MSESPVAVVRALFERVNARGIDAMLELLAPDAVFVVPPEASAEPDSTGDTTARDVTSAASTGSSTRSASRSSTSSR